MESSLILWLASLPVCAWTTVVGFGLLFPSPTMPCSNSGARISLDKHPATSNFSLSALTNVFSGSHYMANSLCHAM